MRLISYHVSWCRSVAYTSDSPGAVQVYCELKVGRPSGQRKKTFVIAEIIV